ncbi:MAG: hypothetical protein ACRCXB_00115 [Aeromonadaceae bacterium]
MKVRDLVALLKMMPGEADVVWQNDDSSEDDIRCEDGVYSIVDNVEKLTSSRLTQVFWGPVVVLGKHRKKIMSKELSQAAENGAEVLASECQHISIVENSISPERDRRNRRFIVYDVFGLVETRRLLLLPDATPEQRALYAKVALRSYGVSALAALLFVGVIVLRSCS